MSDKIKPCPFCGSEDIDIEFVSIMNDLFINKNHYKIEFICSDCNVIKPTRTTANNREEAIENVVKIWNRRVNENDK